MAKATILIVDDEPANLSYIGKILSRIAHVRATSEGANTLRIATTDPRPDLILLDVLMPEMDGYTVLTQLKQNPETTDIPVIFVTALDRTIDEERGLKLGAVDYILKPINPAILLARVKTHLTLKQARDFLNDKNAFLEAEIARRMEDNQIVQNVSIRALAHLAETRNPETGDHILRTQSYVGILAEYLQSLPKYKDIVNDHYVDLLTKSAPLHDIGKVGIPDHILLKQGKLTKDEFEIMKTHAEIGAQSIERAERDVERPVEFLTLAKEIAHWHHECWDGSGYPDGLVGNAIPLSARLMSIADVFDALISPRVYKAAMPYAQAKQIIIAGRSTQFDPDLVDAFINQFSRFVIIANKYQPHLKVIPAAV